MRRHSIAEARGKLSREWLAEGPVELTANNVVIATIYPAGTAPVATDPRTQAHQVGIAAPTPVAPAKDRNLDPRVPPNTGMAHPVMTNALSEDSGPSSRGVRHGSRADEVGYSKAKQASGKSRC